MKPYDFLKAMDALPQRYADELHAWDAAKTPVSGRREVFHGRVSRREEPRMKKQQTEQGSRLREEISVTKLRPLTAGICASLAACLIAAVVFGNSVLNQQPEMRVGTPPSSSDIQPQEPEPVKENIWSVQWEDYFGTDIPVPAGGMVKRLETVEESSSYVTGSAQQNPYFAYKLTHHHSNWLNDPDSPLSSLSQIPADYPEEERERIRQEMLSQEPDMLDLLLVAVPAPAQAGHISYQYAGFTPEGKLLLNLAVTPGETDRSGENYYALLTLPEGTMPDVDENNFEITFSYYNEEVPTDDGMMVSGWSPAFVACVGGKPFTDLKTPYDADAVYPAQTWFLRRNDAPNAFLEESWPHVITLRSEEDVMNAGLRQDFPYPLVLTNDALGTPASVLVQDYDLIVGVLPVNTEVQYACSQPVLQPDGTLAMMLKYQDYEGAPQEKDGYLCVVYAFRKGELPGDADTFVVNYQPSACESKNDISEDLINAANHIPALLVRHGEPVTTGAPVPADGTDAAAAETAPIPDDIVPQVEIATVPATQVPETTISVTTTTTTALIMTEAEPLEIVIPDDTDTDA